MSNSIECKAGSLPKRDESIDIIKGLGIICMVAGHCGSPITKFIYLFHMAIFFIASGYFYNPRYSGNVKSVTDFIKKRIITLWFPFVFWTAIYSILHNFFIYINVYTNDPILLEHVEGALIATKDYWTAADILKNILKSFFLHGGTQIGGAFWFLATLFELSITYCIIDFIIKKLSKKEDAFIIQCCISVVFLAMGYACSIFEYSLAGIDKILSYYILFHGGFTLRRFSISSKERKMWMHILIFFGSIGILIVCNKIGSIALDQNNYENPLFLLIVSFAGWQMLYELSVFIKRFLLIKKAIVCAGQNTMSVVILHFLCFKIVSWIGVLINNDPLCLIAAFPVLYHGRYWWIAYMCAGLIIPIGLSLLYKKIKKNILHKYIVKAK